MKNVFLSIARLGLVISLVGVAAGCHAQPTPPTPATPAIQPALSRRIEVKLRSEFNVPPEYTITLGKRGKSDISGYDSLPVTFSHAGHEKITDFLISKDDNTLARMEKFDLSKSPLSGISLVGRPVRGADHALVTIVNFDDLECPFCGQMHAVLFPGTLEHYKNQVRFIYKDDPLTDLHPWAMHAAVDANCLEAQSHNGYWNLVDYIHANGNAITGDRNQPNMAATMLRLDQATEAEGKKQGVNMGKLEACIGAQDESSVRASMKEAASIGIEGTPTMFINGERMTGLLPQQVLWAAIDRSIVDAGGVPPPQGASANAGSSPEQTPGK